ncbi:MAG TPA: diacylglycerol kinase family protein [Polyangiaceae bacterium]|nr:diacylglycerol kinase family protein [Polyangiaceae bacterium]
MQAVARPWPAEATGPEARRRRDAAGRPDAPLRVGVVINPRARAVRAGGPGLVESVARQAGAGLVRETPDLGSLRAALGHLVGVEGVNVLATLGGDGTLHTAVNELLAFDRAAAEAGGPGAPLPALFALRGGTLNIVGRSLGTAGPPARALARFREAHRGAPLAAAPARPLPLLRVQSAALGLRHGFVFGSEMVRHALEMYDVFGGGHAGLSRFLFEALRGPLFDTELWRRERWRLTPPSTPLAVTHAAGRTEVGRYAAAVACTVDLAIAGGALRALRRPAAPGAFSVRVITETRAEALVQMAPALMTGRPLGGTLDVAATALHLAGSFTLDGEVFPRLGPDDDGAVAVELAAPLRALVG